MKRILRHPGSGETVKFLKMNAFLYIGYYFEVCKPAAFMINYGLIKTQLLRALRKLRARKLCGMKPTRQP